MAVLLARSAISGPDRAAIERDEIRRCRSGHASEKSLEVYQHLSLATVKPAYQRAVKGLEV